MIGKKIKQPFTFSGWIYRSDIANGRWADRVAIEDQNNNGYGLCISHSNHRTYIQKRIGGRNAGNGPASVYSPSLDKWYHFIMHFGSNGHLKLWVYDVNGVCISDVPEMTDTQI